MPHHGQAHRRPGRGQRSREDRLGQHHVGVLQALRVDAALVAEWIVLVISMTIVLGTSVDIVLGTSINRLRLPVELPRERGALLATLPGFDIGGFPPCVRSGFVE